jgi:hypothetical protein
LTVPQPYDNFIRDRRYQPAAIPAYGDQGEEGIWEAVFGDLPIARRKINSKSEARNPKQARMINTQRF